MKYRLCWKSYETGAIQKGIILMTLDEALLIIERAKQLALSMQLDRFPEEYWIEDEDGNCFDEAVQDDI